MYKFKSIEIDQYKNIFKILIYSQDIQYRYTFCLILKKSEVSISYKKSSLILNILNLGGVQLHVCMGQCVHESVCACMKNHRSISNVICHKQSITSDTGSVTGT